MLRGQTSIERRELRKLRTHLSAGISVRLLTCFYRVEQQRNSHKRREREEQQYVEREWKFRGKMKWRADTDSIKAMTERLLKGMDASLWKYIRALDLEFPLWVGFI